MFYERFEQFCKSKGVTPTQAGRENGIKQGVVSNWKKRGSTPSSETLLKLATYFDITPYELTGDTMYASFEEINGVPRVNKRTGLTNEEAEIVRKYGFLNDTGKEIVKSVLDYAYKIDSKPFREKVTPLGERGLTIGIEYNPLFPRNNSDNQSPQEGPTQ